MNYRLTNFRIESTTGNRIADQDSENLVLKCVAINPVNRFETPHNIAIFDETNIAYYKNQLPQSRGGVLPDEDWDEMSMKPEDRFFLNGTLVEYALGSQYCRKYTSDIVDAEGTVIREAGEFICDANGRIAHFDKIEVFCQYQFRTESVIDENTGMPKFNPQTGMPLMKVMRDEHGQPITEWVKGWTPTEVGERMRKLLIPYTPDLENYVEEKGEEVEPEETDAPPVANRTPNVRH